MYYDLTDAKTFSNIWDVLLESWISEDVLQFAFSVYWRQEETFENICYYYWLDEEEILKTAGIEEEEEED